MANTKEAKGKVILDLDEELNVTELSEKNTANIAQVIKKMWESYLHLDKNAFANLLATDARRMSQRDRKLSQGANAILAALPAEWEFFERPDNLISEEMTLRNLNFWADSKTSPTFVIANYWIELEGGVRWSYENQGLVLQIFINENGSWKLAHYTDAWSLNYDLDEETAGEETTFVFDYVYPVKNLQRAVDFYTPILGKPDFVSESQAFFGMKDPMFILDNSGLYGHSDVKKGSCNGYAVLYVDDLKKAISKLQENEVEFLDNTDTKPKKQNNDALALIRDVDGNVIAFLERNFEAAEGESLVTGFDKEGKYIETAKAIAEAWMAKDAKKVAKLHGEDGFWFDASKVMNRGVHEGAGEIEKNLAKYYWKSFDNSENGIVGEWKAKNIKEISQGDYTIVSYERILTGTGNHPFKSVSHVTHVFNSNDEWAFTFINCATANEGLASEVDYTAHPVVSLKKAEKFYNEQLELGDPYVDEDWRGYWSNNTVYGIFVASPEDDELPVENKTNGYVSFLVSSADDTYKYLKAQNVSFPAIPAINDESGVEVQPGYKQVVSTDSEGNVVLFTEYSGKRK